MLGTNHPDVVQALQEELARCGPAMIQTHVADLAGELAKRLCTRAGGRLSKAFFASSEKCRRECIDAFVAAVRRVVELANSPGAFCIRQIFLTNQFTLFDNRMTIGTPKFGAQY